MERNQTAREITRHRVLVGPPELKAVACGACLPRLLQLSRSPAYSRAQNMKMHLLRRSLAAVLAAAALVQCASADPFLPHQQAIGAQLESDAAGGDALYRRALRVYQRRSTSIATDLVILRDLNRLLAEQPSYPTLLDNAADLYQGELQTGSTTLAETLRPIHLSSFRRAALVSLERLNFALADAAEADTTAEQITFLQRAASHLRTGNRLANQAARQPVGFSAMLARFGVLEFRGTVVGGTNFQSDAGSAFGEFSSNGVLSISGIQGGRLSRGIHLHVEGVTTNFPATYPLGVGANHAFYDVVDLSRRREYHFVCDPALTASNVPNAFLSIDHIGTNFILGSFAFVGTNHHPRTPTTTNNTVIVSRGEFQLNYKR
jgi:hypothetical protein